MGDLFIMKKKLHRYLTALLVVIVAVGIYACGEKNTFQVSQIEKEYTNIKLTSFEDGGELILNEKRTEEFFQLFAGLDFEQTQSAGGLNEKFYSVILLNGNDPVDSIQISTDGNTIIYGGYFYHLQEENFDSDQMTFIFGEQKKEQTENEPEVIETAPESTEDQNEAESETRTEEKEEEQKDQTVLGKDDFGENKVIAVPAWPDCKVDLNGDGSLETIVYEIQSSDEIHIELLFLIYDSEGNLCHEETGRIAEWENPHSEGYFLMDLNSEDDYLEIAILDDGPSGDPEFHIIRCDGEKQIYMGSIFTDTPYDGLKVKGDGKVVGSGRLSILQTWRAPFTWEAVGDSVRLVEEEWYYPYVNSSAETNVKQTAPITVYEEPDLGAESLEIQPSDGKVTFGTTDNKNWVQFFRTDGAEGWIYLEDGYYMQSGGERTSILDIFENLNMAG